ncbi:MAG: lipoate--protein ligase [bacterium]
MSQWRYITQENLNAAYGLAVDEMLTHSISQSHSPPILHLYSFKPSVIVGRYQDLEAGIRLDRCRELGIEYNRRITGGGTVIMGPGQLALGLGIPLKCLGMERHIKGILARFADIIIEGLRQLGIKARFRPKNDLEVGGKKMAGLAASVEEDDILLFHMSLLLDFDTSLMLELLHLPGEKLRDKAISCFDQRMTTMEAELGRPVEMSSVKKIVVEAFEEGLGVNFTPSQFTRWECQKIAELMNKRYCSPDWWFSVKHPPERMGYAHKKTPGGLLQIYLSLAGGVIENLLITGDFFSTSGEINRIESTLKWSAADKNSLEKNLKKVMGHNPIYGIDISSLRETIMAAKENYSSTKKDR